MDRPKPRRPVASLRGVGDHKIQQLPALEVRRRNLMPFAGDELDGNRAASGFSLAQFRSTVLSVQQIAKGR